MEKAAKEWELLLHCCRLAIQQEISPSPSTWDFAQIDWEVLLKLAARHQVRPLLYKGLMKSTKTTQLPATYLNQLKNINFQITTHNLAHTKELVELVRLFEEAQVTVLPYKGVLLAQEAYQDLSAREYSDIDFLIHQSDLPIIKKVLENRNYEPELMIPDHLLPKFMQQYYEFNFDLKKDGRRIFHVEPHWAIGPKMYQLYFSLADFTPFLIQKQLFGSTIQTLTPEGLLLSTCLHHGGQDKWRSLKQVSDIAAIIHQFKTSLDWDQLVSIAEKWKVQNLMLLGLGLAATLFDIELPSKIQQLLNQKQLRQAIESRKTLLEQSLRIKAFSSAGILKGMKFHLTLRKNWWTKVKILYHHFLKFILPNENDVDLEAKETIAYWRLVLRKPFRLWTKFLKK